MPLPLFVVTELEITDDVLCVTFTILNVLLSEVPKGPEGVNLRIETSVTCPVN
jgi:hypothetical protein